MPIVPPLNTDYVPNLAGAHQNALATQKMGMQNAIMGEQVQNLPRQRQLDEKAMQLRELALDIQAKSLEQQGKPGPITLDYPTFSLTGNPDAMARAAALVGQFPDQVNDPGFMPWLAQQGISFKTKEEKTGGTYGAPQSGLDEQGNPVFYQVDKEGAIRILKGVKPEPKKGMKIYDREGNLLVDMGGGGTGLEKKTIGGIEQKIIDAKEQRIRSENLLSQIEKNDEFLTIPGKLKAWGLNIADKMNWSLTKEQKSYLERQSVFIQDSLENINLYIKALTGAQMSQKEADRLRLALEDAGEGIFQGNGPAKFKALAKNTIRKAKLAEIRFKILKERGFIDLNWQPTEENKERVEGRYNYDWVENQLKEIAQTLGEQIEFRNPQMKPDEIKKEVQRQLRERYGM